MEIRNTLTIGMFVAAITSSDGAMSDMEVHDEQM